MPALAEAVAADRAAGRTPFAVVATAGTTNCGTVDPLEELADLCEREGLWFHVDGAYGAAAALCAPGRAALAGIGRADSLTIDPHKWLFQPYEAGAVLIREPGLLERTFSLSGEYLRDTFGGEVNFRDRGMQLTRGVRALKLWLSRAGVRARRVPRRGRARYRAGRARRGVPAGAPGLGDRHAGAARDRLLRPRGRRRVRISAATVRDGYAAPSTTVLRGRTVLRLCTINPRTTFEEIEETIERMERFAAEPD